MNATELTYRKTAAQGASGFGLLVALCDTLAGNLRRAADAERSNDIEKRCREVNHALLVVAYLEDGVARGSDGVLAQRLTIIYSSLRRKMIEAQAKRSAEILEQQMTVVLTLRKHWHELDVRATSPAEVPGWVPAQSFSSFASQQYEPSASSWSA
jgi:flagellin-specific chaperone FliS